MKNFLRWLSLFPISLLAMAICFAGRCAAQDNVWTSTASGNWQDASWSLGILPTTNQTIWITNTGWKAVQIDPATAEFFSQSMNINALNISSPTNSFNTMLLNFTGTGAPLTLNMLTIASNSALTMFSSALQINGSGGAGLMVGGRFDQSDSVVAGNQVNVGYIGPGVYNFNSGYFTVSQLWLGGGATSGVFIQNGGTNGFGITHLDGGTYVLSNGWYGATIYFDTSGEFLQEGGVLASDLTMFSGTYVLGGGLHQGSVTVPSPNQFTEGSASVLQTGGTNNGSLDIGSYGWGSYTMSNGVSYATSVFVAEKGSYNQFGGVQTIAGSITIDEQPADRGASDLPGHFNLYGGQVSSTGLTSKGYYTQTGGTNFTSGDMNIGLGEDCILTVSGGWLTANNLLISPAYTGGVSVRAGGTLIITNTLSLQGVGGLLLWRGFSCDGLLVVSNISLMPGAIFSCGNGVIDQSGTLTLANANFYSGSNSVQLGPLCLANGGTTNSTVYMVTPSSVLLFADSSSITWSNESMLVIEGWSGSFFGGGQQQIIFGKNSSGLTGTQLAQIEFHNPAGLTNGMYPARILANGEIVPAVSGTLPANIALQSQSGGMLVVLHGEAGRTYSIETSLDMVHWAPWTNEVNSTGTMSVTDTDSTNYPARFYRARLVP